MSQVAARGSKEQASQGRFWAWVPVGLLVTCLGGLGVMLAIALDDPGFGVEPEYYAKAVAWDEKQAQDRINTELGWSAPILVEPGSNGATLELQLADKARMPIVDAQAGITAFHVGRSAKHLEAPLKHRGEGRYVGRLPAARSGLWELRLEIKRGSQRFTQVSRQELVFTEAR